MPNLPPTPGREPRWWCLTVTHSTLPVGRRQDSQGWSMTAWGYREWGLAHGEGMQITARSADVASNCQCNGKWHAHQSNVGQSARRPACGLYLLRLSNLLYPDQTRLSNRPWYSLNTHYHLPSYSGTQTHSRHGESSLSATFKRFKCSGCRKKECNSLVRLWIII